MLMDCNMVTKDGKKMMYLISLGVNKDCEDYDAIWTELKRRMAAVSIPIVRVDWVLYDDNGKAHDYSDFLFYAQKFEIGMGFIMGILDEHELRSNLEFCNFFNGDAYKNDPKRYKAEDSLETTKQFIQKFHPNEIW
ncbi:MAG: hypothetical protein J6N15_12155 [Ruminiclostridium sp.]|nr:hypothetical protein [Ruminiclostridium sp.]